MPKISNGVVAGVTKRLKRRVLSLSTVRSALGVPGQFLFITVLISDEVMIEFYSRIILLISITGLE